MKKIFLFLTALAGAFPLWAQGSLQLTAGTNIRSSNGGYLVIDNLNIVNNGSINQAAGNGYVKLTGGMNVNLSGSGVTVIDELLMAKIGMATLNLQTNISVASKLNFSGGLLNLNSSTIDLLSTGIFTGESETSRAFTTGSGYIQRTKDLNAPVSDNIGNLGAMISSTANLGNTIIRRGHGIQMGVSGSNNSIRRFYDIIPANNQNLKASLRFFYFDAELNGIPEPSLHQWKSTNNVNWDFVGADARNMSDNYVEKGSINKFDRWTLAIATAPVITCPVNKTVNSNLNGCKASVSFTATAIGIPAPAITYKIGNTVITSPRVFSKGTTTVTATASNGVTPAATCTFTVTVVCGGSPSFTSTTVEKTIETNIEKLSLSVLPNPAEHYFTLNIKSSDPRPVNIRVLDAVGRQVTIMPNVASNCTFYLGHKYRPGSYYIQATQGKEKLILKLIKQGN